MIGSHRALRRGLEPNVLENSNRTSVVDERRRRVDFQARRPRTAKETFDRWDACKQYSPMHVALRVSVHLSIHSELELFFSNYLKVFLLDKPRAYLLLTGPLTGRLTVYHYVTKSREDFSAKVKRGGSAGIARRWSLFNEVRIYAGYVRCMLRIIYCCFTLFCCNFWWAR